MTPWSTLVLLVKLISQGSATHSHWSQVDKFLPVSYSVDVSLVLLWHLSPLYLHILSQPLPSHAPSKGASDYSAQIKNITFTSGRSNFNFRYFGYKLSYYPNSLKKRTKSIYHVFVFLIDIHLYFTCIFQCETFIKTIMNITSYSSCW